MTRPEARAAAGLIKRSLSIASHRTSIALEPQFWQRLAFVAAERDISTPRLVAEIDGERSPGATLSSAIRVYLLEDALARADGTKVV